MAGFRLVQSMERFFCITLHLLSICRTSSIRPVLCQGIDRAIIARFPALSSLPRLFYQENGQGPNFILS